ncbi:MAG: hypothetical protein LBT66_03770 [Methanobrevibacter sp.]|nr:hypothetical protein [Candidatus Methanovirga meridionalis]
MNLENCTFNYNAVEHEGGSIYYSGDGFNSNNCNYTGNIAGNDGGGLYLESYESQFKNNTFTMNVGDNGGAIYHNSGILNLNNNTLLFNQANKTTSNGAGIYTKNGIFNINDNTFERNIALGSGGAIYNQNSKGTINYSIFNENVCKNNGAALYNNHFNVSLLNSSVFNNYAIGNGGAIYNDNSGTNFLVRYSLFANNTANKNGGSIYNTADNFFTYFTGFQLNRAGEGSGGAIYNDANTVILSISDFSLNYAGDSGGAIYNNGILSTNALNITNNAAGGYGGGLYDESNTWGAKDTNFAFNEASKSGDDYYTRADKTANIVGCLVGLVLILAVITALTIFVPAAAGLYGAIGAACEAAGFSAVGTAAAIYGAQLAVILAGMLIFMGFEELVSSACSEFEEWSSKYWYIAAIVYALTGIITAMGVGAIVDAMFKVVLYFGYAANITAMGVESAVEVAMTSLEESARLLLRVVSIFTKLMYYACMIHMDDWIVGVVIGCT